MNVFSSYYGMNFGVPGAGYYDVDCFSLSPLLKL
jgi:Mg2+ and Co2+ transporter CorA